MFLPLNRRRFGDFFNHGYWHPDTLTRKQACENLVEDLSRSSLGRRERFPTRAGRGYDTILAEALPGFIGDRHQYLSETVGVVSGPRAGCQFLLMSATAMEFENASFDNVICVEAAFHFNARERCFREAHRVLKLGGAIGPVRSHPHRGRPCSRNILAVGELS
jgi:SAM-dependent methyltransferase